MNIQQLEYILAVHQLKNFSRAAAHCNVTQATLSFMIKKLEDELGLIIFDRKHNPILTTDAGLEILAEAQKVLVHTQLLQDKAKNMRGELSGQIRVGIIPTIANALLPKIIRPIIEKYPSLSIEIIETTTAHIVKQLRDGQLDAGILATPLGLEDIEENILYYEALMVYGNFEEDKKYIIPDEIRNHKIWLMEEGHCLREQFIKLCSLKKKCDVPENFKFEANSFETLLNMVDEFGGLTMIPELYFQTLPNEKKRKVRHFVAPIPVREVSLIYFRPFAKQRIIQMLTAEIAGIVSQNLASNDYPKHELVIAKI
ncbi:LysR family transcriptional regulator, hydrogen peroxide-inducible genes activator [Flexibacter flexilis DSM 6793]|uniref:LysR family transcriptional regulator, hydrogen peroxide-inducible genes activator n=1 Tax=Flexibacter flexilis DSM 6793 TaxID=927664 RepID=A0A1I1LDD6_9BACT|nr:LysR substrate-binding domain-containing protein [Flexibacter flexilis]SFC69028.1 LysR family transcriptional regulator, hydrogen peroxide-inducible genes activator [Flexibacter flexilis DSM 6793]